MKMRIEKIPESVKDTVLGYVTVILSLCVFLLLLIVLVAVARVLVG